MSDSITSYHEKVEWFKYSQIKLIHNQLEDIRLKYNLDKSENDLLISAIKSLGSILENKNYASQ